MDDEKNNILSEVRLLPVFRKMQAVDEIVLSILSVLIKLNLVKDVFIP